MFATFCALNMPSNATACTSNNPSAPSAQTRAAVFLFLIFYRRYEMLPEVKLLREAQRRRQEIVERRVKAMQVLARAHALNL